MKIEAIITRLSPLKSRVSQCSVCTSLPQGNWEERTKSLQRTTQQLPQSAYVFACLTRTGSSKLSELCCCNNETSKQRQRSFPESNQFLNQHNTFYFSLLIHLLADDAINLKRTVFHPCLINRLQTV